MFSKLLQIGVHPGLSFQQQNKIRVFNTAIALVFAISVFFFIFALASRFYFAALATVFSMVCVTIAWCLVKARKYRVAFHFMMAYGFTIVTTFSILMGDSSKSYFYFLFLPVGSTILFDNIKTSIRYMVMTILFIAATVLWLEHVPPYYNTNNVWFFGYPNMVFTVLLIFLGLRLFKSENIIYARQIEAQKHKLEEKNKEMTDSINYARRIQYTLLAHEEVLNKNLPEHFVLFKPKDIVSGDFYWAAKKGDLFYLAVCDSTGHGVPGAFMSLLNSSFLNEAVNEKNIVEPHKVLNYVRGKLIENISQDGARDGMDAILICYDKQHNKVTYAAANNTPWLVRGGQLQVLAKDKMPVGQGEKDLDFTLHSIDLQPGDCLYLSTDGYADQFGGPQGKKFKARQLEQLLQANHTQNMHTQKQLLENSFEAWRGQLEQVDDVCLVGIRF